MIEWLAVSISIVSVFISIATLWYARDQASAARRQADAAFWQATEASESSMEAKRSGLADEISVLEAVRARIDAASPSLIIGIESISKPYWIPRRLVTESGDETSREIDPPSVIEMDGPERFSIIGFIIRGIIRNVGDRSAQVQSSDIEFIEDETPMHKQRVEPIFYCRIKRPFSRGGHVHRHPHGAIYTTHTQPTAPPMTVTL
jgi:type II secretory pathway pseudopilin PulG